MSRANPYAEYKIRVASIPANVKRPMLLTKTRWDYLTDHLPVWREMIRFRVLAYALCAIGVYALLFTDVPVLAPVAIGLGIYYYMRYKLDHDVRIMSQRRIIQAG